MYFDQFLGAASTQKLVEVLIFCDSSKLVNIQEQADLLYPILPCSIHFGYFIPSLEPNIVEKILNKIKN